MRNWPGCCAIFSGGDYSCSGADRGGGGTSTTTFVPVGGGAGAEVGALGYTVGGLPGCTGALPQYQRPYSSASTRCTGMDSGQRQRDILRQHCVFSARQARIGGCTLLLAMPPPW